MKFTILCMHIAFVDDNPREATSSLLFVTTSTTHTCLPHTGQCEVQMPTQVRGCPVSF